MSSFSAFSADDLISYAEEESKYLHKDYWRVMQGFRYYIGGWGSNHWVDIPLGYLTDGASVPRIFWNIIPPWGQYGQAAVVHDYLCNYLTIQSYGVPVRITRKRADEILLEAMTVLGVSATKKAFIYAGVTAYRVTCDVTEPNPEPEVRKLEAAWLARRK